MTDVAALAELLAVELRRASGPGVAKARSEDAERLRRRSQKHAEQVSKIAELKRLGWSQAEIARRLGISEPHLSKLISDGHTKGNRFQLEDEAALDQLILEARVEALNCG